MMRYLALVTLAACGFDVAPGSMITPIDADPDALGTEPGMPDDATDAPPLIDAPPAASCHGTFETVCLATAPATSQEKLSRPAAVTSAMSSLRPGS